MSDRIPFFYCHGSSYVFRALNIPLGIDLNIPLGGEKTWYEVSGLRGETYGWDGFPGNDPFPDLLDSNIFEPVRINYPASFFPMGQSIDQGRTEVLDQLAKPEYANKPFVLGGYSQGAAVMVHVWNALPASRRADMLGAVMFGNPRRTVNWRGPIGGTWSGAMFQPGSTGGGGSFPATGPYARMVNPPPNWVDFAAPNDPITSVNSATWSNLNNDLLTLSLSDLGNLLGALVENVLGGALGFPISATAQALQDYFLGPIPGQVNYFVDGVNNLVTYAGNGHTTYPFLGPPNADGSFTTTTVVSGGQIYLKPAADTCYQLAARWLESLAGEWATTPIIVPETPAASSAWSTTLTSVGSAASLSAWSPIF